MEKFISKRLKRSAVYNEFLELIEHYNEELQDLTIEDFICVYNANGGDFVHLISKHKVMAAYYEDSMAKYNDIWCYISANGNEVYIKASEIDRYDVTHTTEQIHMKCYDYAVGHTKEGECTLKYEKFGGPYGKLMDQQVYHYDAYNNLITNDADKYLTFQSEIDGITYSFSGVTEDVIKKILNGDDKKNKGR